MPNLFLLGRLGKQGPLVLLTQTDPTQFQPAGEKSDTQNVVPRPLLMGIGHPHPKAGPPLQQQFGQDTFQPAGNDRFVDSPLPKPLVRFRLGRKGPGIVISQGQFQTEPAIAIPGVGSLTLTGYAPAVATPRIATPGAVSLTISAFGPTVLTPRVTTPVVASLTITGLAPAVSAPRLTTPGAALLTISGIAPVVSTPVAAVPGPAALTLTLFAPTASATSDPVVVDEFISTSVLELELLTYAPTVTATVSDTRDAWYEHKKKPKPRFPAPLPAPKADIPEPDWNAELAALDGLWEDSYQHQLAVKQQVATEQFSAQSEAEEEWLLFGEELGLELEEAI